MKKTSPFKNILIVGLGVMGGSYLKRLAQTDVKLYAIEIDQNTINNVRADQFDVTFISLNDTTILKTLDLVILTLYPKLVVPFFDQLNGLLNDHTLVCEISGIKQDSTLLLENKRYNYQYLLVHPMAGRESGGYAYSDACIFENANHIIINEATNISPETMDKYLIFIDEMGFNKPISMSSLQHDQAITYTSQLTHVLAISLINSSDYKDYTKLSIGDSFRDLTRIAKLNIELWSTLFVDNEQLLSTSIDNLIDELLKMKELIKNNDDNLHDYLKQSLKRRIEIDIKE